MVRKEGEITMATIKSYTDLSQSKKLAEILPLESADMYYQYVLPKSDKIKHNPEIGNPVNALKWYNNGYTTFGKEPITLDEYCVPCWSLTGLLGVLPSATLDSSNDHYYRLHCMERYTEWYDNAVDACYEMIIKLHDLNLL